MKGLRKILRVSSTAKKTNEWVFNKAAVKKELLDTVKARKLYSLLWSHHDKTRELHGEDIMQRTTPGARRRERHARTACVMDKIKTWAGLLVEHQNDRGQREIEKVRPWCGQFGSRTTKEQIRRFVTSRVDYCNAIFAGASKSTTDKLQRVMNAAARVVSDTQKYDRGLSHLLHDELHWLDVLHRVQYKLHVQRSIDVCYSIKHHCT